MGGRGSFVDVNTNNFVFKEGGQTYFDVGRIGNDIKVLEKPRGSVKVPEFSHTENRIYVVLQKGKLKHIGFYDDKHELIKSIDFQHFHGDMKPHVHHDVHHKGIVTALTESEQYITNIIKKWLIENNKIKGD